MCILSAQHPVHTHMYSTVSSKVSGTHLRITKHILKELQTGYQQFAEAQSTYIDSEDQRVQVEKQPFLSTLLPLAMKNYTVL